ncbi:MAG: hypothetical protein SGARI_005837 [Bacillariaceae sp.]
MHNNQPAFEVCAGTVMTHFSKQNSDAAKKDTETKHFRAETHDGYQVKCIKDVQGEWKGMQITNVSAGRAKAVAAAAASASSGTDPPGTRFMATRAELDHVIYSEITKLCPKSAKDSPVYFFVRKKKKDEEASATVYRPTTFPTTACPSFDVGNVRMLNYFDPTQNKSGQKKIPKGMRVSKATLVGKKIVKNKAALDGWFCCKVLKVDDDDDE